jgi:citrate lyase subunit beta/citryl-CoA lyase
VLQAVEEGEKQGKGAVTLDGSMIDRPMVLRAESTMAKARAAGIEL